MAHTYTSFYIHAVFSTRRRQKILSTHTRTHLRQFMQTTAAKNGFRVIDAGGTDDHMHVLLKFPSTMAPARAIQFLKRRTATLMGKTDAWQEGFAAITINVAAVPETIEYIARQHEVHAHKTFEEEIVSFLRKNEIRYDLRYVFD